jgi:hypothetical protein
MEGKHSRDILQSISNASRLESQVLGANDYCVPITVAFTHNYSDDIWNIGAKPHREIEEVRELSKKIAEKFNEEVVEKTVSLEDLPHTNTDLLNLVNSLRALWIISFNETSGHAVGIVREKDGFVLWDAANPEDKIQKFSGEELMTWIQGTIHEDKQSTVFGFKKSIKN